MAEQKIGLAAVLEMSNFEKGLKGYLSGVAEMTHKTTSVASSISSQFVGLGQGVLKFGALAGGAALVGVAALTTGLVVLGGQALTEYAKFERLSLSITNLVAREISQGKEVEQQRTTIAQLTAKEAEELQNLTLKIQEEGLERQTQLARIQEQKQRIIELTAAYGENGLNVQTAKAKLAEMEFELTKADQATAGMTQRVNELNNKNGQMVTVLEKVRVGQMSMSDAMLQAAPKAQELLKWIELLAIQSPFTQEGIADAFRTAMAYGFTTDQAKRLTAAEVDFAAATGKGVEATNLIALALGQMQAKGKVSGQEIIQLTNAGIGVNKILEDMGFTLDDVSKGLVDSDAFIEAVITDMEIFKGAAKEQSTTFSGLISSLEDLKAIGLREFFTGTFKAVQPYLADFVSALTDAALTSGKLRVIGDVLGGTVARALKTIAGLMTAFSTGGTAGLVAALGITPDAVALFDKISGLFTDIATTISSFLAPALDSLSDPLSLINSVITFLNLHFEEFKGALLGIGAVLAAGVFAALVAAVLSLLTPINLIIAGAALLGAAWAGNWGDIQGKTAAAWAVIQPVLQDLWTWLSVNIPLAIQAAADFWNTTLLPALTTAGNFITTTVIPALVDLYTWLQTNLPAAIQTVSDFWNTTLSPALQNVGSFITTTVIPAMTDLWTWLNANLPTAIQTLSDFWTTTLLPAIMGVSNFFTETLIPLFSDLASLYIDQVVTRTQVLSDTWNMLLVPITAVSDYINSTAVPFFEALGNVISAIVNKAVEAGAGLWQNVLHPALTAVGDYLSATLQPVFQAIGDYLSATFGPALTAIGDYLSGTFGPAASNLGDVVLPAIRMAFEGIATAVQDTTTWLNDLAANINNLTLPAWLTPGSPTPFEQGLLGIATAVQGPLLTAFTVFGPMALSSLAMLQQKTLAWDQSIQSIYLVTLPTLQAVTLATAQIIISAIQSTVPAFDALIAAANRAVGALQALGAAGASTGSRIASGMNNAADGVENLIELLQEAVEAFDDMAASAREAANAARTAGSASGASSGVGFSQGIGFSKGVGFAGGLGLGWTVPAGFPRDSFGPMYAQTGEQILITPKGLSIDQLIGQRMMSAQPGGGGGLVVNINVGSVNNGMDLAMLDNHIQSVVAGSFG